MFTKRIRKRKAISTFIATLLLMVLAVAAGVVIYAYTMGYLGGFSTPSTMGSISIDTYTLDPTVAVNAIALNAYIRNIGHAAFTAGTVYVDGILVPTADWNFNGGASLAENGVGLLTINQAAVGTHNRFQSSVTTTVKIVGVDNTQLQFQIKK